MDQIPIWTRILILHPILVEWTLPSFPPNHPARWAALLASAEETVLCGEECSHVLHQILWRGRIADDGPVYLFELTFEGDNFDGIWGPNAYACHPIYGGVGFHQWIYGQPRELPMNQRGAHVANMVQRTLRFLDIPDPFPEPPAQ